MTIINVPQLISGVLLLILAFQNGTDTPFLFAVGVTAGLFNLWHCITHIDGGDGGIPLPV